MRTSLPFRQIHLDFHTSPYIGEIGVSFDKIKFAEQLKKANINSINVFAKCHHGMCYYPTKVGTMHPNLSFDLLGSIIQICHSEGIKAPIYIATGWEEISANNADWLEVSMDGVLGGKNIFDEEEYRWRKLCHNHEGYIKHILSMVDELINLYEVDGFWFDIVYQNDCVCKECVSSMKKSGLNPKKPEDVKKNGFKVIERFMKRLNNHVLEKIPDASIYFNMHLDPDNCLLQNYSIRKKNIWQTHFEIESLPSGEWGYNHFPLYVNYLNTFDKQIIGMNGKFHRSWGDFGTLKNQEALEYETFRMFSNGCRCCIGDQMHPQGLLDDTVYEKIGSVYSRIKKLEPFMQNVKKIRDIAVLVASNPLENNFSSEEGVMRMLLELHKSFDFIDLKHDLDEYSVLVLPDHAVLTEEFIIKMKDFLTRGGKIIATHISGIGLEGNGPLVELLGLTNVKSNPYVPSYVIFSDTELSNGAFAHVMYPSGLLVKTLADAKTYGEIYGSYFNRTWEHFSGHCQSPVDFSHPLKSPVFVERGNVFYCVYPIFKDYIDNGLAYNRKIFEFLLGKTLIKPFFESNLPVTAEVNVWNQKINNNKRIIVHLLHYIPQKKNKSIDVIDGKIPLVDQEISIHLDKKPVKVYDAESLKELPFYWIDDSKKAVVHIDNIYGYRVIVIE